MSNKAVKDLVKIQESKFRPDESEKEIKAVQALLAENNDNYHYIKAMGLDHGTKIESKLNQDYKLTKEAQAIYGTNVFLGKTIKEYCNKYNLKILNTRHFNGTIPAGLSRIVTEFLEKNQLSEKYLHDNFFILAPVEQFRTMKHVPINRDPILFFKRNSGAVQEDDELIQVCNWGNDFTFWREFMYLFYSNTQSTDDYAMCTGTYLSLGLFLIALIFGLFGGIYVTVLFCLIGSIVMYSNGHKKNRFIDKLWNEEMY